MTPQEESMLNDLIGRVDANPAYREGSGSRAAAEPELGRNPDALYILAQTVLVQKYALEQAQAQLRQLQQVQQQQPPAPPASWAACWVTMIRRPRRLRPLRRRSRDTEQRPMLSPGPRFRVRASSACLRRGFKLSAYRRDDGRRRSRRSTRL
jgi:hypothetical protein